jgi:Zn-dependent protease with chaperone function
MDPQASDQTSQPWRFSRTIDATTAARLLIGLPWLLTSLTVVWIVGVIIGQYFGSVFAPILLLGWLASGAVVFWEPAEEWFAQTVLRCRRLTPQEQAHLAPIWTEVTTRAGIDGSKYSLWVEPSVHINASACAGHIVTVTDWTIRTQDSTSLAGLLAHELGHHVKGHAWSRLLVYSLPGRAVLRVGRAATRFALFMISTFSTVGWLIAIFALLFLAVGVLTAAPYILLLFVLPYATAYVGRAGELGADRFAAQIGYGEALLQTLRMFQRQEETALAPQSAATRALATHPETTERIRALEFFLGRTPNQ